ncbi:ABC transporter [Candidatus Woesebacteria bacterium RBG_13_34_9]|uniref:ABC transporter n=1 Tax=Candidatus Woesebacteria bacterium RBG_13_34_9 TaxID=1802477 RepID=A0A1F7X319_9BACT|nr:MAG: ABC transporter [Candidatus Woesebacteria bacterium RBG_13_34_9]
MVKEARDEIEKVIVVDHLAKNFEITIKEAGFFGKIHSLLKTQKKIIRALKNISFTINRGEFVGFIGPNGAGKTTTLKILSGVLYPSSGFVQVLGFEPWQRDEEYLRKISLVMGQKNQLWWDLPASDTFELNRAIYQIPTSKYKESLNELVDLLDVKKILNIQVRKLSLGQRMRLELVAALLHSPKILFLDEPTMGLDVVVQQKVRDFLFEYNKKFKTTIILTSHNMDDIMDLTKRVIVVDKGKIIFDGLLRELVSKFAKEKIITVYFSKAIDVKKLDEVGNVKRFNYPKAVVSVSREVAAMAAAQILENFPVADLTVEEEPIDEVIRRFFRGEKDLSG